MYMSISIQAMPNCAYLSVGDVEVSVGIVGGVSFHGHLDSELVVLLTSANFSRPVAKTTFLK